MDEFCLIRDGDKFIDLNYPGAVENMNRNFAAMSAFLGGYALIAVGVYKYSTRNRTLH